MKGDQHQHLKYVKISKIDKTANKLVKKLTKLIDYSEQLNYEDEELKGMKLKNAILLENLKDRIGDRLIKEDRRDIPWLKNKTEEEVTKYTK